MPTSVNITMNDDGTFTVTSGDEVANFAPSGLIFALEEIVFQFRENRVKLTTEVAAFNKFHSDLKKEWVSKVQVEEAFANGGLGQMGTRHDQINQYIT